MTHADAAKKLAKNALLYLGLTVAMMAAIPLLACLVYCVRLLVPLLIVAAIVALAVSPTFRRWFMGEADSSSRYRGVVYPAASLWVHPAHGWASVDRAGATSIGIDTLALTALGTLTAVRLPEIGTYVKQGQTLFSLVHGERRLEVKAPLSGRVTGVNQRVVDQPTLISERPYGSGWVVRIEPDALDQEKASLRHGSTMRRWWRGEVERFSQRLGGALNADVSRRIDDAKWLELASELFGNRTG